MACRQCGDPGTSDARLCAKCIAVNQTRRTQSLEAIRAESRYGVGNRGPVRAEFGIRLGCYSLDSLANWILTLGVLFLTLKLSGGWGDGRELFAQLARDQVSEETMIRTLFSSNVFLKFTVAGYMAGLVSILYRIVEVFFPYSPAKYFLGLKIALPDGSSIPLVDRIFRAFVKNFWFTASILGLIFPSLILEIFCTLISLTLFLGCFVALGENRRALHDYIAGSAVYYQ